MQHLFGNSMFSSIYAHSLFSARRDSDNPHDSFQSRGHALSWGFRPSFNLAFAAVGKMGFSDGSSCGDLRRRVREVSYVQDPMLRGSQGPSTSALIVRIYTPVSNVELLVPLMCMQHAVYRADEVCCGVVVYALQNRKNDWFDCSSYENPEMHEHVMGRASTIEDAPHIPVK